MCNVGLNDIYISVCVCVYGERGSLDAKGIGVRMKDCMH